MRKMQQNAKYAAIPYLHRTDMAIIGMLRPYGAIQMRYIIIIIITFTDEE